MSLAGVDPVAFACNDEMKAEVVKAIAASLGVEARYVTVTNACADANGRRRLNGAGTTSTDVAFEINVPSADVIANENLDPGTDPEHAIGAAVKTLRAKMEAPAEDATSVAAMLQSSNMTAIKTATVDTSRPMRVSAAGSISPSHSPTQSPNVLPTESPTKAPSASPTMAPSHSPTKPHCQDGWWRPAHETTLADECRPCPPGKWGTEITHLSPEYTYEEHACTSCPGGRWGQVEGTISEEEACEDCIAGMFRPEGYLNKCEFCAIDTFANASRSVSCAECPDGWATESVEEEALRATCTNCWPLGQIEEKKDYTSLKHTCQDCPSGQFRITITKCTDCPEGWFAPGNDNPDDTEQCVRGCPLGHFCPNDLTKLSCPLGRFGNVSNATTEDEGCPGRCDYGTGGWAPGRTDMGAACAKCPAGFYSSQLGQGACSGCPVGTFMIDTGSTDPNECHPDLRSEACCKPGGLCAETNASKACPLSFYGISGCGRGQYPIASPLCPLAVETHAPTKAPTTSAGTTIPSTKIECKDRCSPSTFCRTLFQIERTALHSYGSDPHSC